MNLFSPAEFSANYANASVVKSKLSVSRMLFLSFLAGMLIGFPSAVTNISTFALENPSVIRFVSGLLFAFGLGLVVMTGAELFTGNTLMLIGVLDKKISVPGMLRNWGVVYVGNFLGSMFISFVCARFGWVSLANNGLANFAMKVAQGKMTMPFENALMMGVLCNILVTIGVLVSLAGKDGISRFIGAWAPVMFFVTCGFNHSIADMTYCMMGLFAKGSYPDLAANYEALTWGNYFTGNLIPVTLGNTIGGCFIAFTFWFCFLRKTPEVK